MEMRKRDIGVLLYRVHVKGLDSIFAFLPRVWVNMGDFENLELGCCSSKENILEAPSSSLTAEWKLCEGTDWVRLVTVRSGTM